MKKYIDADTFIEHCCNTCVKNGVSCCPTIDSCDYIEDLQAFLSDAPAADVVEVVHGHWLNFVGDYVTAECSVCGECYDASDFNDKEHFDMFKQLYKFCPNCGARTENSRQHTLQTGVCPMCEDCPDGCPVKTPNDSRNRPENEPLTLDELHEMPFLDWVWIEIIVENERWYKAKSGYYQIHASCPETAKGELWFGSPGITYAQKYYDYGKTWLAYHTKPERSEGE